MATPAEKKTDENEEKDAEEEPEEEVVDKELVQVGQMTSEEISFEEFLAQV